MIALSQVKQYLRLGVVDRRLSKHLRVALLIIDAEKFALEAAPILWLRQHEDRFCGLETGEWRHRE
jgi:hypothetical protein